MSSRWIRSGVGVAAAAVLIGGAPPAAPASAAPVNASGQAKAAGGGSGQALDLRGGSGQVAGLSGGSGQLNAAPAAVRAAAVPRGAAACRLIDRGRIRALATRPTHVTLAFAPTYGSTEAQVTECTRTKKRGYVASFTTPGRVGRAGFAPAGRKREGDGRTPSGVYRLGVAFGAANPGSRMGYLKLRPTSCWGSTVGSKRYNRYYLGTCGPKDERMYNDVRGAYRQGMLIRYNTDPVRQGRGSAIFFHVGTGGPTAGCVSIPLRLMTAKVRTTRPGDVMVMGVTSSLIR